MKIKTTNRLLWIRVLMIVSQVFLLLFIALWLMGQYNEQKQLLKNGITEAVKDTEEAIADSVMYRILVGQLTDSTEVKLKDTNINGRARFSFTFSEDDDIKMAEDIREVMSDTTFLKKTSVKKVKKERVAVYQSTDITKASKVISGVMNILTGLEDAASKNVRFDAVQFNKVLGKYIQKNNWPVTTEVHIKRMFFDMPSYNPTDIIIESEFYEHEYSVAVSNYSNYLLKKITPQIFFTFILLLLTSGAFYLTFRSLRAQMKLNTMKNDLISNMTHELKTPISTVKVALEAISSFNVIEQPEKTREYIGMATMEMNRLDMLVNQALHTALLENGKIVLKREPIDMKKLVEDTLTALKIKLEQKNAAVNFNYEGDNFTVSGDRLHLQGVLLNLIDNSLKYAKNEPIIDIKLVSKEKNIEVAVSDNGPGIPEEYINKVFDKFFRVPTGDIHNVKGYGLGLSYCKQMMLQHEGDITVHNNKTGCTFSMYFPKYEA
jgi:signal transduction histidine kinase